MLKCLVVLCLTQAIIAVPYGKTTETEDFRSSFLSPRQGEQLEELTAAFDKIIKPTLRAKRVAVSDEGRLWPNNTVYYKISSTFKEPHLDKINKVIKFFNEATCIRWVPRTDEREYVDITNDLSGCFASVGYKKGEKSMLNLADEGCFASPIIIVHEMFHNMGFYHMHQAPTRDDHVTINWENVRKGSEANFKIARNADMLNLPYEHTSCMHYGPYIYSGNHLPTMVAKYDHTGTMGQINYITVLDVLRMERLYNCPEAWEKIYLPQDIGRPYPGVSFLLPHNEKLPYSSLPYTPRIINLLVELLKS